MTSVASAWVRPLFMPRLRWPVSCAIWPEATSALMVTRLRSRGAKSGRSQSSRKRTSVVYCTMPGNTWPNSCPTRGHAVRLRRLVEGQARPRRLRELIGADLAGGEDILHNRDRRHGIPPAGVEREVRDHPGYLARLHAVIEREVEIVGHLDRLVAGDHCGERHDAAVAGAKIGPLPEVAEKTVLLVMLYRRGDRPHIVPEIGLRRRSHENERRNRRSKAFHVDLLFVTKPQSMTDCIVLNRHSRESGNPVLFTSLDPRLRGGDDSDEIPHGVMNPAHGCWEARFRHRGVCPWAMRPVGNYSLS